MILEEIKEVFLKSGLLEKDKNDNILVSLDYDRNGYTIETVGTSTVYSRMYNGAEIRQQEFLFSSTNMYSQDFKNNQNNLLFFEKIRDYTKGKRFGRIQSLEIDYPTLEAIDGNGDQAKYVAHCICVYR